MLDATKPSGPVVGSALQAERFTPARYKLRPLIEARLPLRGITIGEDGHLVFAEAVRPEVRERALALYRPEGEWPYYVVRPPRFYERIAFRRELTARGAVYPGDAELIAAERDAIGRLELTNGAELLALLDRADEARATGADLDEAAARELAELERGLMAAAPFIAQLIAAREHWLAVLPAVSFALFCDGWGGLEGELQGEVPAFRKVAGMIPDAVLDRLPPDDIEAAGWRANSLMAPSKVQEKN